MERAKLNHIIRFFLITLTIIVYIMAGAASVGGITIYLALLFISAGIGLMDITCGITENMPVYGRKLYNYCVLMIVFIALSFAFNFISFSFSFNRMILIVCSMGFAFLCANTLHSPEEIRKVCWAVIIPTAISAIVVIGQGMNIDAAYRFANIFGAGSENEVLSLSLKSERYYGLAKSALYFGYQASAAVAMLVFMPHKIQSTKTKYFRFILLSILIISLLFNRTRSAQISVIIILFVKLVHSGHINLTREMLLRVSLLFVMIAILGAYALRHMDVSELISAMRLDELDHAGTTARIPMFLTAMNSGIHHPFGMGIYRANPEYVIGVTNTREVSYVLNNACHNLLANCVGNHGIFTGILLVALYITTFKECMYLRKNIAGNLQEMTMGTGLAIAMLLLNGAMHNLYVFSGDLLTWLSLGVLVAIHHCSRDMTISLEGESCSHD